MLGLAQNVGEKRKAAHPLERIVAIEERSDELVVTTTDMHLVRAIGEAIRHAYRGELDFHYEKGGALLRMRWSR